MGQLFEATGLLTTGFWILMLIDCARHERERTWLWIVAFLHFAGALAYFIVKVVPRINIVPPSFFNRWTKKTLLWNAEADARNIGKAHQYVNLGNVLLDMRYFERAETAYKTALEKEPNNVSALWGVACLERRKKNLAAAREHLATLVKAEPNFRYGEAALIYGKVLIELQDWHTALAHLETYVREWSNPEGRLMLATVYEKEGKIAQARDQLETMIVNLRGGPRYHYNRNRHLIRQAEQKIKSLK